MEVLRAQAKLFESKTLNNLSAIEGKEGSEEEMGGGELDKEEEVSMLNGEISMLQDENDELREENENLIKEINGLTFQFEAEIEKLQAERQEYLLKAQQYGKTLIVIFRETHE